MLHGAVALKEDNVQFVTDAAGDIPAENRYGYGLYSRDTRYLSRFELTVNGRRPLHLSHTVNRHYIATFQAINDEYVLPDGRVIPPQTVSIRRSRFVTDHGLYERIGLMNCNPEPLTLTVSLALDADFRDMFAVRGFKEQPPPCVQVSVVDETIRYVAQGRDGVIRESGIAFSRQPDVLTPGSVEFLVQLAPQQSTSIVVHVRLNPQGAIDAGDFDSELERLAGSYRQWEAGSTAIATDNTLFDRELLRASRNDIRTLLESTPHGMIPDAGVPWYAVPFGRDAIITGLQTLIYNPSIAEGTLRYLAAYQGRTCDPRREEEPGKIMHEIRRGELASLREIPHTPYYGTADATPLFVVLFCETMAWTGDEDLYRDLLPAALAALEWVDRYGDRDGDGYVEYAVSGPGGVINQGWKDSPTSVLHEDGSPTPHPISLVEVQGYVYAAKSGMAGLLRRHGEIAAADRLAREAAELKRRFNRDFWMDDERYYATALDANKRQVRMVTSNAGHCLWSGIADDEKADLVADRLLQPDMFSGWGIRTLSSLSAHYNPMSYHTGSIWPHDTALIALGLRRAGRPAEAVQVVDALLEAGFRFPDARLPELFSGFARDRRFNSSPAAVLRSCSPQAWAAGAVFMLLQTLVHPDPDPEMGTITVDPVLPDLFDKMSLTNVRVGNTHVDITVTRDELPSAPLPV